MKWRWLLLSGLFAALEHAFEQAKEWALAMAQEEVEDGEEEGAKK